MKFKESETVELKASTAQLNRALESLCAFANTNLGTVYFGIEDDGRIIGQEVSDRTIRKITTDILSQIEPRLFPNIWVEEVIMQQLSINSFAFIWVVFRIMVSVV